MVLQGRRPGAEQLRRPHDGGRWGSLIGNTEVHDAWIDPATDSVYFARPGQPIATGQDKYYLGVLFALVFLPIWFVYGIVVVSSAGEQGMSAAVQTRAWAWPGLILFVALLVIGAIKPVLHGPTRRLNSLARGDLIALPRTSAARQLAAVARAGEPGAFEQAVRLEQTYDHDRQARRLRELADLAHAHSSAGAPEVPAAELIRVADPLQAAAEDERTLIAEWCAARPVADVPGDPQTRSNSRQTRPGTGSASGMGSAP